MMSHIENNHTVIACPSCAKKGDSRGALQSYCHQDESDCLYCAFCGWKGTYETCQSYEFPCKVYKVVEIDMTVVENFLSIALQQRCEILPISTVAANVAGGVFTVSIPCNDGAAGLIRQPKRSYYELSVVLNYLVSKGWLFPAMYKVSVNV